MYSPIVFGRSPASISSMSSSSIELASITKVRPLIGFAYGFAVSELRIHTSVQPTRRPR